MLSTEQLASFHTKLMKAKEEVETQLQDHFDLDRAHYRESMGELSTYDNHPADEGTALYEREKDVALNEHKKLQLLNINKALEAIENGTYGKCQVCGKEIPLERLEALETTTYCMKHSPDQITSHNRPIEEQVLKPPFGQFDLDERDESVAFDAEDSWQRVAEWGTSESPSDLVDPPDHYNDMNIEAEENLGYVEDFENFIGNDMDGKNITVYPNNLHEKYEQALDEEGIMTTFGDLPAYEHDPYADHEEET
ncbi:YteA family regulatory protein [Oikeobacillus pervagus]|uniref:YteA family regulatory protein n=1 Tax=Oikeobacillus pervagus TaxID=1325931 RepID=A0AAJ1WGW1_9BACI|nr:TraR/DksA C4-type zinc finger protein [Oikeobacillus pervagus]MDQ0215537.1 YteA family regulatory protein [Oikeobacillus pervagus]